MSCGVGCRCSLDAVLLWLWRGLEATARIRPLAWELPYAEGAALEEAKRPKKKKKGGGVRFTAQRLRRSHRSPTCVDMGTGAGDREGPPWTTATFSASFLTPIAFVFLVYCLETSRVFFFFFRAAPAAYGGSQAGG